MNEIIEYQKRDLKAMSYLAFRFPHKYFIRKRTALFDKQEITLFEYYCGYELVVNSITMNPENKINWKWKKNVG